MSVFDKLQHFIRKLCNVPVKQPLLDFNSLFLNLSFINWYLSTLSAYMGIFYLFTITIFTIW